MANSAQQIDQLDDLDALFAETEEGVFEDLDFDVEEVTAEDESDAALKAAQEEMAAEEEVVEEEGFEIEGVEIGDIDDLDLDEPQAAEDEEAVLDDLEADLKAEERQERLEAATLTEDEAEKAKRSSMGEEASKQKTNREAKRAESKGAINVSEAVTSKVGASADDWVMFDSWTEADVESYRDRVLAACDALPKKTREKALNLIDWNVRGTSLSVYSRIALDQLITDGEISSASLRHRYMSNPGKSYTIGTSNAQTGQLMKILATFELIDEDGAMKEGHAMIEKFKATHM